MVTVRGASEVVDDFLGQIRDGSMIRWFKRERRGGGRDSGEGHALKMDQTRETGLKDRKHLRKYTKALTDELSSKIASQI